MGIVSHKCPNCGAEINFDPKLQKGKCDFCLSEFSIEELEKLYQNECNEHLNSNSIEDDIYNSEWENVNESTVLYSCPRCGAQVVTDKTTSATFCCYCHGPIVISDNLSGEFKPSKVIPFKINRERAVEEFLKWSKTKWFVPTEFTSYKQLEKITGIYIPFWLVNSNVTGNIRAEGRMIKTWTSGDYRYTKTDVYNIYRQANMYFENVPNNASTKVDDDVMETIEPFRAEELKEFSMAYLPGFLAEKYDKSKEEVLPNVESRIKSATTNILRGSISGYSSVNIVGSNINFNKTSCNYALLPVWLMTYSSGNKNYIFAMNGQTGKVFGSLPLCKVKLTILAVVVFLICFIAILFGGVML